MRPWRLVLAVVALTCSWDGCSGQALHQDSRCICKCPDPTAVTKANVTTVWQYFDDEDRVSVRASSENRSVYVDAMVRPEECDCKHVVLRHLNFSQSEADSFCPRCACKYQIRSLTIIKVVVILVIWVISILVIYMGFLSCLDPILNKRAGVRSSGTSVSYREHRSVLADDGSVTESTLGASRSPASASMPRPTLHASSSSEATQLRTYGSAEAVINRLGHQQTRWKQQVQEQRRNIYDRHAMLN